MDEKKDLILRDWLAIERTKLANERTFLAYFRTAFVFLVSGLSFLKIDYFQQFQWLGWTLLGIFPIILIFGIVRLLQVRKGIIKYYS